MGKIPDDYVSVQERIENFRKEYDLKGSIETELSAATDNYIVIRAKVLVDGKVLSMGQALVGASDDSDKAFEKAEASAIGRALKFFKYADRGGDAPSEKKAPPSRRASDEDDDEEPSRPVKAKSKPRPSDDDDDEDEAPPPKKKSAPLKKASKSDDDEDDEEAKPASKSKAQSAYEDLKKKYGADDEED